VALLRGERLRDHVLEGQSMVVRWHVLTNELNRRRETRLAWPACP
jgi:hypothetical protein